MSHITRSSALFGMEILWFFESEPSIHISVDCIGNSGKSVEFHIQSRQIFTSFTIKF